MTMDVDLWVDAGSGGTGTRIAYTLAEPEVDGTDPWPSDDCTPRPTPNDLDFVDFQVCE